MQRKLLVNGTLLGKLSVNGTVLRKLSVNGSVQRKLLLTLLNELDGFEF